MFVSHLASRAAHLDEAAFVLTYPRPALVFEGFGRWINDRTPHPDEFWAKTDHGAGRFLNGKTEHRPERTFEVDGSSLVVFLTKSQRNNFGGMVIVGRKPNVDVIIPSSMVSKVHAVFLPPDDTENWTVIDQSSTNGTTLNGQELERGKRTDVRDGDRLLLAQVVAFEFHTPEGLFKIMKAQREQPARAPH